MEHASRSTTFSIAKDGKYHDAIFSVEGDEVSVIYWGRDGVTRCKAQAESSEAPDETARKLLREMI